MMPGIEAGRGHEGMAKLLAAYEVGALTDEERRAFEAHALDCDACFAELDRSAAAVDELRRDPARFRRALAAEPGASPPRKARGALWWILLRPVVTVPVAAALLIGIALSRWNPEGDDPRDLATFPIPTLSSELLRGEAGDDVAASEPVQELLRTGLAHLDLGRPDEAELRFRAVLERDPQSVEARYLLGLSLARRGRAGEALPLLEEAAVWATGSLRDEISWTLANAYLSAGRIDDARARLERVVADGGARSGPARELLARLPR